MILPACWNGESFFRVGKGELRVCGFESTGVELRVHPGLNYEYAVSPECLRVLRGWQRNGYVPGLVHALPRKQSKEISHIN